VNDDPDESYVYPALDLFIEFFEVQFFVQTIFTYLM